MSRLSELKAAGRLHDVARLLDFRPPGLAFILYKKPHPAKYAAFDIAKRNGGVRTILAPDADLKLLQQRLSVLLQDCIEEINRSNKWASNLAHGFVRKRSIVSNAERHRNRRYVFNIDLADFFSSINFGRVRGFFIKDKNFKLDAKVATVLAQIACFENKLPQGSPSSPVISNLIGHVLDIHLFRLAAANKCAYTRYADDITFSTNTRAFPSAIAVADTCNSDDWTVGDELSRLVAHCGFTINRAKTRMQYRRSRQEVTGLVVNRKVNIRFEYRHLVRAMAHRLFQTGQFEAARLTPDSSGALKLAPVPGTLAQLHGMLGHIDQIDIYNKERRSKSINNEGSSGSLTSKEHVYRRFLYFKHFHASDLPVIVCEGKTDNVYLRCAIRARCLGFPDLGYKSSSGSMTWAVRLFKFSSSSTGRVLGLRGGTGDLRNLVLNYDREAGRFKAPGGKHPLIVLLDNDDGGKKVFSVVKQITGKQMTGSEDFVHVRRNLYIVPTPLLAGAESSQIEDSFPSAVLAFKLAGKSFDRTSEIDTDTSYGKTAFAEQVVKPSADTIDFSGFDPLLKRLTDVIAEHKRKLAPPGAASTVGP